jgi:hypothetical protein
VSPLILIGNALLEIGAALARPRVDLPGPPAGRPPNPAYMRPRKTIVSVGYSWRQEKQKPKKIRLFEPSVETAKRLLDAAQQRLNSALRPQEEAGNEPSRLGAYDEAWRQLCQACQDGAIKAYSDEGEVPASAFFNPGSHQHCGLHNEIMPPSGCYHHVKFLVVDITRFWPMPASAGAGRPERASEWMFGYAKNQATLGHKVKKQAAIQECVAATGVKWRQAEKAYDELSPAYKNRPRGRSQNRAQNAP